MWQNPQETADLATFTEEIFNIKLHFLVHRDHLDDQGLIYKIRIDYHIGRK